MAQKYWYLIVLDPTSHVGKAYLAGNNDGTTTEGAPVIRCSEIDLSHQMLFASRKPHKGPARQDVYLPYHAVTSIFRAAFDDITSLPFGFSLRGQ